MSKYLKKFETQAAYTAAQSSLILPNVSLITENNKVEYNPLQPTPPTPSHEYVDLGLPSGTKWATMNVGATGVTDYGNYYQYGKGAATYQETSGDTDYEGEEDPLAASADTATQAWGGEWHMPTSAQCQELIDNTTYEWVTDYQGSGINGGTFTANGKTLFIPAEGQYYNGAQSLLNERSVIWTSTPDFSPYNFCLIMFDGVTDLNSDLSVKYGFSIRPVMDA